MTTPLMVPRTKAVVSIYLNGVRYDETPYGYRAAFTGTAYTMSVYATRVLSGHWPKKEEVDLTAYQDPAKYVLLPCVTFELAIRLAALYCRHISDDPKKIHWLGEQIAFEIKAPGMPERWGTQDTIKYISDLPTKFRMETPMRLLADEVDADRLPSKRMTPLDDHWDDVLPVLYLDTEHVLVIKPESDKTRWEWRQTFPMGEPAPGAKAFLSWAAQHFDLRWCANDVLMGEMGEYQARRYAQAIGLPESFFRTAIRNPRSCWPTEMTRGIDFSRSDWAFITDALHQVDVEILAKREAKSKVYLCNASENPGALIRTWHYLRRDFKIAD